MFARLKTWLKVRAKRAKNENNAYLRYACETCCHTGQHVRTYGIRVIIERRVIIEINDQLKTANRPRLKT